MGAAAVLALTACATLPQYGVATTTVTPRGNCDTSRVVPVGVPVDLSGGEAQLGREYLTGLQVAVDQVNHARGVLKAHSCLELLYKDTQGNVRVGTRAILDLINKEGVAFLVAPLGASEIQFAGSDLARAGVPTAIFSSLGETYQPRRYPQAFPLTSSAAVAAAAMTSFAHSKGWTRIAIVATADPVGEQGAAEVTKAARHNGVTVSGSVTVTPGAEAAAAALRQLEGANPEVVVLMGESLDVTDVLKARDSLAWKVPVVGQAVTADQSVIAAVGFGNLQDVFAVVPQGVVAERAPLDPAVTNLRDQVRRLLHVPRLDGSIIPYAQAADAIAMLASVSNSIHSTAPGPVRTYLENANFQGLLASYSFTSDTHTGMGSDQVTVAPVSSLSDGLFRGASPG